MDISAPHWFYNNYTDNFSEGMQCAQSRDSSALEGPIQEIIDNLPWASSSLPVIKNMQLSDDLLVGFRYVTLIENSTNQIQTRDYQWDHLMAIAGHEQGAVLQPLIYEDPVFASWAAFQRRWWVSWASPDYELVFSHACKIRSPILKSEAPNEMVVENFESRMDWIVKAADKFHTLMDTHTDYMLGEMRTIAGWKNTRDYRMPTRSIDE